MSSSAKSELAYESLKDQFRDRTVKKIYHAIAGIPNLLVSVINGFSRAAPSSIEYSV